ncbi:hypothetical protein N7517_005964 [Penicillium concentricum]|uniref:Uncharacterized protein n=1 Tax=Penicillium concentricum TaxID=293559 RepID=A0A9W9V9K7_9EURO|nr:uncharacterized protein N7517_005964 [Penicillium concentricum]KAJ5373958.1 hypothetical protein N7517_005964 [Penicillium concentricum]
MSSPANSKDKLFPGISATETKLLVLANVCLKNDKVDYDKLAVNAGIKASSAQTLFRNAKRKLDKLFGDDNADTEGNGNGNGNGAQADMSPEETPSKRGKSTAKAKPRTPKAPKTPKIPKTPKTPKATKTPKGSKGAVKFEESEDQIPVDPELSPTTTSAAMFAEDTSRETAVVDPFVEPFVEPAATVDATKGKTEDQDEGNENIGKYDKTDGDALDLAVNQQLSESPLPQEEDDPSYEEDIQEDEEHED